MNQFFTVLKMITEIEVPVQLWSNEDVNSFSKAQKKKKKKKTGVRKSSYKGHHLDALM